MHQDDKAGTTHPGEVLLQILNANKQSLVVKNTLEKCLNYAETHFIDEEKLMIASKFSGYNEHKHTHDEFREKCQTMYANFDKIPVGEAIKFAHFLHDWIQSHIAYEDKLYIPSLVDFLKKRKEK